jgi:myo-inositol-1(or 4)-monophosphatase
MNEAEARKLAELALAVAHRAAPCALRGWRVPKKVSHKGAVDLVTDFDTDTERLIRDELARATPGIPIVSEELGGTDTGGLCWYVDPIDGTTNYAHGHPFWCVSIGLAASGTPVAGAVLAPALHGEWVGWAGGPARRNAAACSPSRETDLGESLLATGFPYDRRTSQDDNLAAFGALKKIAMGVRRCGSAAIDLCFVADGTYDGYWERKLHAWDVAAGVAIVGAAGGTASSFDGGPVEIGSGNVVASNGRIHAALLAALARWVPATSR